MSKINKILVLCLMFLIFNINVNAAHKSEPNKQQSNNSCEARCSKVGAAADREKCLQSCKSSDSCEARCSKVGAAADQEKCLQSCKGSNPNGGAAGSGGAGGIYNNGTSGGPNSSHTNSTSTASITMKTNDTGDLNCDTLFGTNTATGKYVHDIYNIIKFAVPILLLALSIKEFGAGIISQDNDALKKAISKFSKRLIIAIVILVLPTVLNYFFELIGIKEIICVL